MVTKRKKPPLRLNELRALRATGGMSCKGVLVWDTFRGLLKSTKTDTGSVYSYQCPNCKAKDTTEEYRKKCGRKLQ